MLRKDADISLRALLHQTTSEGHAKDGETKGMPHLDGASKVTMPLPLRHINASSRNHRGGTRAQNDNRCGTDTGQASRFTSVSKKGTAQARIKAEASKRMRSESGRSEDEREYA